MQTMQSFDAGEIGSKLPTGMVVPDLLSTVSLYYFRKGLYEVLLRRN